MSELDALWARVCRGDRDAFGDWMGRVESPLRRGLAPFARNVDVEGVVQETLLRMWVYAQDRGVELAGEDASLRWAHGMARNIARNEARRHGRERAMTPADLEGIVANQGPVAPDDPPTDPFVARAIRECLDLVVGQPLRAIRARLEFGHLLPDQEIAQLVGMKVNTFRQNLVRAREQLRRCLEGKGVVPEEWAR